jgi:hypothetical protein
MHDHRISWTSRGRRLASFAVGLVSCAPRIEVPAPRTPDLASVAKVAGVRLAMERKASLLVWPVLNRGSLPHHARYAESESQSKFLQALAAGGGGVVVDSLRWRRQPHTPLETRRLVTLADIELRGDTATVVTGDGQVSAEGTFDATYFRYVFAWTADHWTFVARQWAGSS